MGTFIVPESVHASAGASRCVGLAHATSVAAEVRNGMPPGKGPGGYVGGKK
jgi:hypothetical protein